MKDYNKPNTMRTSFDTLELNVKQFEKGLRIASEAIRISISDNDVWGYTLPDGSVISSYERIGYHASTACLLIGFLAGNCPIILYRRNVEPICLNLNDLP